MKDNVSNYKNENEYENKLEKFMIVISILSIVILTVLANFTNLNFKIIPRKEDLFFICFVSFMVVVTQIIHFKMKDRKSSKIKEILEWFLIKAKLIKPLKGEETRDDKYIFFIMTIIYCIIHSSFRKNNGLGGDRLHHLVLISLIVLIVSIISSESKKDD